MSLLFSFLLFSSPLFSSLLSSLLFSSFLLFSSLLLSSLLFSSASELLGGAARPLATALARRQHHHRAALGCRRVLLLSSLLFFFLLFSPLSLLTTPLSPFFNLKRCRLTASPTFKACAAPSASPSTAPTTRRCCPLPTRASTSSTCPHTPPLRRCASGCSFPSERAIAGSALHRIAPEGTLFCPGAYF